MRYGKIGHGGQILDECMAVFMQSPRTYTKEDVVEIHCHGGRVTMERVIAATLNLGAIMAEPGEFTKRAFLNGRVDLAAAEAVMDLINSRTEKAQQMALSRLSGKLSQEIQNIRETLLGCMAHMEVAIDYPEYDVERLTLDEIAQNVRAAQMSVEKLMFTFKQGRITQDGIKTVICGKPNVGKSSLLNWLLCAERAIVTHIPGTTRDIITESLNIDGIPLILTDTAGIRETADPVEAIGVSRTKAAADEAELLIAVFDGAAELGELDLEILTLCENKTAIAVVNKTDLGLVCDLNAIEKYIPKERIVLISVHNDSGKDGLIDTIKAVLNLGTIDDTEQLYIASLRHYESLKAAQTALMAVTSALNNSMSEEFIALDLAESYAALGKITGETVSDDLIDRIFAEFCLGK